MFDLGSGDGAALLLWKSQKEKFEDREGNEVTVNNFLFKLNSAETGWNRFTDGKPEWVMDQNGVKAPKPPHGNAPESEKWKRGIVFPVVTPDGDEMEVSTSAVGFTKAIEVLGNAYKAAGDNRDPLVSMTGVDKQPKYRYNAPVLTITGYADETPFDLPAGEGATGTEDDIPF
jgi:hypothetical protein